MNALRLWMIAAGVGLAVLHGERAAAQEGTPDTILPVLEERTPESGAVQLPALGDDRAGGEGLNGTPSAGAPGTPPAGGAPGRQSVLSAAAPVDPATVPLLKAGEALVLGQFGCPREAILRMLKSATTDEEFSTSLALEREVIVLCGDRQKILAEMVESDRQLAEVLRQDRTARMEAAAEAEAERKKRAVELATAREILDRERQATEAAEAARVAAAAAPPPEPEIEYSWYTVIGRGDDLRAGVTGGETRMFVRVGDSLPGGIVVTGIDRAPPGVRVRGASVDRLPYRPLGGG